LLGLQNSEDSNYNRAFPIESQFAQHYTRLTTEISLMPSFKTFRGSESGKITEGQHQQELGPKDVLIETTHSGLCGTDVHYKHADIALGHEGVGIVKEIGSAVRLFKVGDRAGWGYLNNSCGHCKQCLTGMETFCAEREIYGDHNHHQGSLGSHVIWDEDFIFNIPDSMSSEDAAPLMCGGATVFNTLKLYNARPSDKVGIIGIGGLGHLAIQYAAKMGCEVVVFSGTANKKEEAEKLGATEFVITRGVSELKVSKKIDHLLVTTASPPDWELYIPALAPSASIYPLTVDNGNISFPYMPLIQNGFKIQGSMVAARQIHREMLEFSALHGIKPIKEMFPLSEEGIEEAFQKLEAGKMRYRAVLVV
jgi:D-arabinose 1-dehydrogenase-like Zn-dependent alcohol dehydrogenase